MSVGGTKNDDVSIKNDKSSQCMFCVQQEQEAGVRSLPGLDITLTIDDAIPILYQGSESEILGIMKIYM